MLGLMYLEGHPGNAPGLHDLGKDADIYVYDLLVLRNWRICEELNLGR